MYNAYHDCKSKPFFSSTEFYRNRQVVIAELFGPIYFADNFFW